MNWWDAFKLIMKFIPCITSLVGALKAAKGNDDKVDMEELSKIMDEFFICMASKVETAVKANEI